MNPEGMPTLRSAGNEGSANAHKEQMFYRTEGGGFVDAASPRGKELGEAANQEHAERLEEKKQRIDREIATESQDVEATIRREMSLMRAFVQTSLQPELQQTDAQLRNPAGMAFVDFDMAAIAAALNEKKAAKERVEQKMIAANQEMNVLAKGVQAWRTHQYPGPEFPPLIDALEGQAASRIAQYMDVNDPEYKQVRLRMAGLAFIKKQLEQAQTKANPSSRG